jgi:hypothetical protein
MAAEAASSASIVTNTSTVSASAAAVGNGSTPYSAANSSARAAVRL